MRSMFATATAATCSNSITQATYRYLAFSYGAGGVGSYLCPAGRGGCSFRQRRSSASHDSLGASGSNVYLNNTLVKSVAYSAPTPNWSAASNFDLGAQEYLTFGGYNTSDDIIDEFTVWQSTGVFNERRHVTPEAPAAPDSVILLQNKTNSRLTA
jgi:hypothetical protein